MTQGSVAAKKSMLRDRGASVSLMFATMAVPLVVGCGLAVDYSFYVEAQSQLDTAADAGALHAVRVASAQFVNGASVSDSVAAGRQAAQQWWNAQLGTISDANIPPANVVIPPVSYNASTGTFTETVSYTGAVTTHVGALITAIASWPIGGSSTAAITANSYSEFMMLVDNSSSMLIGASPADIIALENVTICAPTATAVAASQSLGAYSWNYPGGYGYGQGQTVPTPGNPKGSCATNFSGGSAQCPYPQSLSGIDASGFCPAGTGIPDSSGRIDPTTHAIANIPQAPCGFACHTGDGTHDYYTLSRNASSKITLRFDVIQAAMANVVSTLISSQKLSNQFAIGVYQFNSGVTKVHPLQGCTDNGQGNCQGNQNGKNHDFYEADNDLTQAAADISNIATPVVADAANTAFPTAINYLATNVAPAGSGGSPSSRQKFMFIITDGLEDDLINGRTIGPMTSSTNETTCAQLKSLGINIYVLYTPYYPLPNSFYLNNGPRSYVEPTVPPATSNPVIAALQACATTPQQFYQATDTASINTAMQSMVQSALASPGGFTN